MWSLLSNRATMLRRNPVSAPPLEPGAEKALLEFLFRCVLCACLNCCLPVSSTVCLSQLLFACLNYCSPSTTVRPELTALLL